MITRTHLRSTRPSAEAIAAVGRLGNSARGLATPGLSGRRFFERLIKQGLRGDAIQVLPHLLHKRSAVWWGCLCAWQAARPAPRPEVSTALRAALAWVFEPSEEHRLAARSAGQNAGMTSSAGCLALAAFWSEGSLAAPESPPVPPAPHLTAGAVAGAVLLAAVENDAMKFEEHYGTFLSLGLEVARGRLLWAPPAFDTASTPAEMPAEMPAELTELWQSLAVAGVAEGRRS